MKKILFAACFFVSSLNVTAQAFAQSAFEGAYIDLSTGYEKNSVSDIQGNLINFTNPSNSGVSAPGPVSDSSPLLLELGYNFPVRSGLLVGVGLNYSLLPKKTNSYRYTAALTGFEMYDSDLKISNRINVFLAPGYAIAKDKLIYLKFGYTAMQLEALSPARTSDGPHNGFTTNPAGTISGYMLGIGYKQIVRGALYGFAEANYMNYGHVSLTTSGTNDAAPPQDLKLTVNPTLNTYQLRIGAGYQF